jgi:hypothetical protein
MYVLYSAGETVRLGLLRDPILSSIAWHSPLRTGAPPTNHPESIGNSTPSLVCLGRTPHTPRAPEVCHPCYAFRLLTRIL